MYNPLKIRSQPPNIHSLKLKYKHRWSLIPISKVHQIGVRVVESWIATHWWKEKCVKRRRKEKHGSFDRVWGTLTITRSTTCVIDNHLGKMVIIPFLLWTGSSLFAVSWFGSRQTWIGIRLSSKKMVGK